MKTQIHLSTLAQRGKQALLLLTVVSCLGTACVAAQVSLTELLEKGIYSEETKGDLEAALKIYKQVVAEAKTGQSVAAQAQYRLGVCLYKKRSFTEATAAFEKLVKDYPDQKDLVALANKYLAGAVALMPAPWVDGEELCLDIKTATGFKLGFVRYSAEMDTINGQKIWRVGSRLVAGPQQVSRVEVDANTFSPIHCRWKHTLLGDADTTYSTGHAELKMTGKDEVKTVELEGVCYDNEEVVQLIRRLPLASGFNTTIRVFTGLGGGSIVPIKLEVIGQESVQVPAGTFECYKVKINPMDQVFYYSIDEHRTMVKFDANGITAELTKVNVRKAEDIAKQWESAFDFPLGSAGGGVPTVEAQNDQPPQNQAKLMMLSAVMLKKIPSAANWCEALNASGAKWPSIPTNTVFALNAQVAGREVKSLPADTVVFFETAARGWNRSGGAELLAKKTSGVAVAFADGRALLVDPAECDKLRWAP